MRRLMIGLDGQVDGSLKGSATSSSLSFTQGFLLGQLTIVLLIGAFIKFFVFGEIPSSESTAKTRANRLKGQKALGKDGGLRGSTTATTTTPQIYTSQQQQQQHVLRPPPLLTTETILRKTYYNVHSHQPESLDWFNVLIAQTIAQFRSDASDDNAILTSLTSLLNGPGKPDFLGKITVTEINLGEEFPILSNCRVHPIDGTEYGMGSSGGSNNERLQARMDVDISDFITMGIDTKMILNYPRPNTAVLPVALAVSVVRFSGTLSISFLPSSSVQQHEQQHENGEGGASYMGSVSLQQPQQPPSTTPTTLAFSFLPDYRLDLSVRSLVGSRSRLQDIPKIAQLVENRLHQWIDERCVEPRMQQVVLPSLWPRKKNTRGPPGSEHGEHEGTPRGSFGRAAGKDALAEMRDLDELRRARERTPLGGERDVFEDGLRLRRREYEMPGALPGSAAR